jgi:hypothetical protein
MGWRGSIYTEFEAFVSLPSFSYVVFYYISFFFLVYECHRRVYLDGWSVMAYLVVVEGMKKDIVLEV